jgi:ribosomal protein L11 methyltransferase
LTSDEEKITVAATSQGFVPAKKVEKDNWLALQFEVPQA